jgi:hypothetical protein
MGYSYRFVTEINNLQHIQLSTEPI